MERARARARHWTESNEIMLLSSLSFPLALCWSANKERVSSSSSLSLSPSGFPAAASAAGKVSKYEEKCDHTFITPERASRKSETERRVVVQQPVQVMSYSTALVVAIQMLLSARFRKQKKVFCTMHNCTFLNVRLLR